ncbi:MAG: twin-arginine translocation pathway signal, partial [Proteobacteria bacterium]|nr:twin-arginine translocation pathway signal [Pseudomonadota bacterium]
LVAHGMGSDPDHCGFLERFSNEEGSNATSRGAYITWEWYTGKYGTSIRLGGLDGDNSNALPRAIVMHAAGYATPEHVEKWGRLGRSNGCFAMAPDDFNEALWHLSGGRLLYADKLGLGPEYVPPVAPLPAGPGLEPDEGAPAIGHPLA